MSSLGSGFLLQWGYSRIKRARLAALIVFQILRIESISTQHCFPFRLMFQGSAI